MSKIRTAVEIIGLYTERDKLLRLVQYLSTFLAGSGRSKWGQRLLTIAQELGGCRTVLRLFDDIPMLAYNLAYGRGSQEPNKWLNFLQLMSNIANQLFYPFEHIAWLAQKQIIKRNHAVWALLSLLAWGLSLVANILSSLTKIILIRRAIGRLQKMKGLEAQEEREDAVSGQTIRDQIRSLKAQQRDNVLALIENGSDFFNAVNWLPAGYLWGSSYSTQTTGMMGTISTLVKMYRLHAPKVKAS